MLRDAYVSAVVALHFPTFDRMRQERRSLAQVTVVLPRTAVWLTQAELLPGSAAASASPMLTRLDVRIPLVVQAPPGGTKLSHRALPLINRTAFFRIMEGQVLEALNVQDAWPDDLEEWAADRLDREEAAARLATLRRADAARRDLVAGEARRRSGPRHIREVLAPLLDADAGPSTWSAWLRTTALSLARQDHGRRRIVDREED